MACIDGVSDGEMPQVNLSRVELARALRDLMEEKFGTVEALCLLSPLISVKALNGGMEVWDEARLLAPCSQRQAIPLKLRHDRWRFVLFSAHSLVCQHRLTSIAQLQYGGSLIGEIREVQMVTHCKKRTKRTF